MRSPMARVETTRSASEQKTTASPSIAGSVA
jgi:hypothetical protein